MKTLIILISICCFSNISFAQKIPSNKVPAALTGSFKDKFPSATAAKWEKEGDEYEVTFKLKKEGFAAKFDATGKWLETEQQIKVAELPMPIQNNIKKEFPGFKIEEACKLESLKDGHAYEAEVVKGKESWDLIYTMDGKLLSKMKEVNDTEKE